MTASSSEMDALTDHLFLTTEGLDNQLRYEAMINRQTEPRDCRVGEGAGRQEKMSSYF